MYVCVRGDQIGHVLDRRNMEDCPNFSNLSKKPAAELKALVVKALEEQRRQLKEHEGSNRKVEKRIEKELKWVQRLDPAQADKEARRSGFDLTTETTKPPPSSSTAAAAAAASSPPKVEKGKEGGSSIKKEEGAAAPSPASSS